MINMPTATMRGAMRFMPRLLWLTKSHRRRGHPRRASSIWVQSACRGGLCTVRRMGQCRPERSSPPENRVPSAPFIATLRRRPPASQSPARRQKEHPMADDGGITIVQVPFPDGNDLQLRITVGPAKLRIAPGDGSDWVSGTYTDPSGRVPCRIATDGTRVRISQESRWRGLMRQTPVFDLQ